MGDGGRSAWLHEAWSIKQVCVTEKEASSLDCLPGRFCSESFASLVSCSPPKSSVETAKVTSGEDLCDLGALLPPDLVLPCLAFLECYSTCIILLWHYISVSSLCACLLLSEDL